MRRLALTLLRIAPAVLGIAIVVDAASARADVTIFDRDGWTFRINGLVAAHYQLVMGDADPTNARLSLVGGRIIDDNSANEVDRDHRTLTMSKLRSGFVGTQIGFGMTHQISPHVSVDSMLSLWVAGIDSNRGVDTVAPKATDFREAWAAINSPYGTLKFGRMFGLFAEGSAEVQMIAWRYGVGHPCVVSASTVACGSTGAGPLYPGFDAAIRYSTPRLAGLQFVVSLADPVISPFLKITPYPRVDTEISYDQTFGGLHLRLIGQTMFERIGKTDRTDPANPFILSHNVWGAMGTGIVSVGGLTVGGGGWQGSGIGERIPLETPDAANPIATDNDGNLRQFRGFYGNAQYAIAGSTITVGGGELFVKPTAKDLLRADNFVIESQLEGHVVLTHKWDAIIVNIEYMHWQTAWIQDIPDPTVGRLTVPPQPKQALNFMGAGINYVW